MTAYLAILKDSFREAIASRVLLISLLGLIVALLLLAPFRLKYDIATMLRRSEVTQPFRLLKDLTGDDKDKSDAATHLWSILSKVEQNELKKFLPEDSEQISELQSGRGNRQKQRLVEKLNQILGKKNFYEDAAFQGIRKPKELEELLSAENLTERKSQRRNVLLFASAFPRSVVLKDSSAIYLMYGTGEVFGPIPMTPSAFQPLFEGITVAVVAVFLGFFGVFGTLLITAGIIPRTFEPGEITLLASKPIRRSGLFLTKFLGGCIFTLIFAIVLVTGVWIILGTRFETWNHQLLWCIPIYVFLFMIYYSVSALSGAIWKNPTVSLTVVVLFWLVILVVGLTHEKLSQSLIDERGIKEISIAGDQIITVDGQRQTWLWNREQQLWTKAFDPPTDRVNDFIRRFRSAAAIRFVPIYDAENERILAIQANQSPFGGMASPELVAGSPDNEWERVSLGRIPSLATTPLMNNQNELLLLSKDKILKYAPPAEDEGSRKPATGGILGGLLGSRNKDFQELQPKNYEELSDNFTATLTPTSNTLLTYSMGKLTRLVPDSEGYRVEASTTVTPETAATVAASDQVGILCFKDGTISVFDTVSLEMIDTIPAQEEVTPKRSEVSPDSRYIAVLTHDETVLLFDAKTGEQIDWSIPENGSCSAVAFNSEGKLLVTDGRLAVRQYDVESRQREAEWAQPETGIYSFYDYVITPLHSLLPRPSELDRFAAWTLSGDKEMIAGEEEAPPGQQQPDTLLQERDRFSPLNVLWKNGLFIAVLLTLGCVYVSRSDF